MTGSESPDAADAATEGPQPSVPAAPLPTNPFVPRYREPWVNPAKRTATILLGLAGALVLLVLGFVLGLGVGGHGRRFDHRFDRGFEMRMVLRHPGDGPDGWLGRDRRYNSHFGPNFDPHYYPGWRGHPAPPAPTAVPSTSHS